MRVDGGPGIRKFDFNAGSAINQSRNLRLEETKDFTILIYQ